MVIEYGKSVKTWSNEPEPLADSARIRSNCQHLFV